MRRPGCHPVDRLVYAAPRPDPGCTLFRAPQKVDFNLGKANRWLPMGSWCALNNVDGGTTKPASRRLVERLIYHFLPGIAFIEETSMGMDNFILHTAIRRW